MSLDLLRPFAHRKYCTCRRLCPRRPPDWIDTDKRFFLDEDLNQSLPRTRSGDRYKIEFDQRVTW
jgi:hypothetical protein